MNVSLTPELEEFVSNKVGSGLYTSASEVIRQALRALIEKETEQQMKLQALQKALQDGIESGEPIPWDLEQIKKDARKRKKEI